MDISKITVEIGNGSVLTADVSVPEDASAVVIFSHGSGSSRFSKRNRMVAEYLNNKGFATVLADLLTEEEDFEFSNRFNIDLLTQRLIRVTNVALDLKELSDLPVGYFGASTGAASALSAAATIPEIISAVVSRGGRPDLAATALSNVRAATLLIVGSLDTEVISLNKEAYSRLYCEKKLRIINGASHLFEEPGKLKEVAQLSALWFGQYLAIDRTY